MRRTTVDDQLVRRGIRDPRVIAAFTAVDRARFVPGDVCARADDDAPLPIGSGQTISQPYVVAMTVEALALRGDERVLEIGTGSGYAAAILGELAREVETVERIAELADRARALLAHLGYGHVHVHHADGTRGWPAGAPYAAIAVAAGAPRPPRSLLAQLAIGGRLVLPHGDVERQRLSVITRRGPDLYTERDLGDVRFVPLVGEEGWPVA